MATRTGLAFLMGWLLIAGEARLHSATAPAGAMATLNRMALERESRLAPPALAFVEPMVESGAARGRSSRRHAGHAPSAPSGVLPDGNPPSPILTSHPGLLAQFAGLGSSNSTRVGVPDQGLCVANGRVLEVINNGVAVFDPAGALLSGITDLRAFFGYPLDARVFDPSCLFDLTTDRWFVVAALSEGPLKSALLVAVSTSADPLDAWLVYRIAGQSDGTDGTPSHPECPCLQDFPHMAFDEYGLHISSSEKSFAALDSPVINGPQIFSVSKRALASGVAAPVVVQLGSIIFDGVAGFGLWPAVATAGDFAELRHGTQFFLQSVMDYADLFPGVPREISGTMGIVALSNTRSLDKPVPALVLRQGTFSTPPTLLPLEATQKVGDFPLGQCLNDAVCAETIIGGGPFNEVEERLQNFSHVEAAAVRSTLYAVVATAVDVAGQEQAGMLWLRLRARMGTDSAEADVLAHDYLAVAGNDLLYPTIAVGSNGRGVVGLSLSGPDHFPGFGFARATRQGLKNVHLVAAGVGPLDDRSGYVALGADPLLPISRFGDYGAAAFDGTSFWIAGELVTQVCELEEYFADPTCGGTRHALSNFATHIVQLTAP